MIQEGLEYLYLINSLIDIQLWVPYNDLMTLYYHLSDPGIYRIAGVVGSGISRTLIERTLYLCLISFCASLCDQVQQNMAKNGLPKQYINFDNNHTQIIVVELLYNLDIDNTNSEYTSPKQSISEYFISLSPITSSS